MALFLNGKQIDKENVYADNIPMSASDSDTIAEKFADFTADLLPIESGSATNTKAYIDSGLSGKQSKIKTATFSGTTATNTGFLQTGVSTTNTMAIGIHLPSNLRSGFVPLVTDYNGEWTLSLEAANGGKAGSQTVTNAELYYIDV